MTLAKQVRHFNGKDQYFLGISSEGRHLWLTAESWDCSWYWSFGYIAGDGHFESLVGFKHENDYIHHLNESPKMRETVLTEAESWELCDLMKSFYTLKETAEIYHTGNSHLTGRGKLNLKNEHLAEVINQKHLPQIFARVKEILTPEGEA